MVWPLLNKYLVIKHNLLAEEKIILLNCMLNYVYNFDLKNVFETHYVNFQKKYKINIDSNLLKAKAIVKKYRRELF